MADKKFEKEGIYLDTAGNIYFPGDVKNQKEFESKNLVLVGAVFEEANVVAFLPGVEAVFTEGKNPFDKKNVTIKITDEAARSDGEARKGKYKYLSQFYFNKSLLGKYEVDKKITYQGLEPNFGQLADEKKSTHDLRETAVFYNNGKPSHVVVNDLDFKDLANTEEKENSNISSRRTMRSYTEFNKKGEVKLHVLSTPDNVNDSKGKPAGGKYLWKVFELEKNGIYTLYHYPEEKTVTEDTKDKKALPPLFSGPSETQRIFDDKKYSARSKEIPEIREKLLTESLKSFRDKDMELYRVETSAMASDILLPGVVDEPANSVSGKFVIGINDGYAKLGVKEQPVVAQRPQDTEVPVTEVQEVIKISVPPLINLTNEEIPQEEQTVVPVITSFKSAKGRVGSKVECQTLQEKLAKLKETVTKLTNEGKLVYNKKERSFTFQSYIALDEVSGIVAQLNGIRRDLGEIYEDGDVFSRYCKYQKNELTTKEFFSSETFGTEELAACVKASEIYHTKLAAASQTYLNAYYQDKNMKDVRKELFDRYNADCKPKEATELSPGYLKEQIDRM